MSEVRAPFQRDVHISVVGARLGLLPSALGEGQQRALGGEEERGYPEAFVAQLSRLEHLDAEDGISNGTLLAAMAAVEDEEDCEKQEFLDHGTPREAESTV